MEPDKAAKVLIASEAESCNAVPSETIVAVGGEVTFLNLGQGKITLLFPDEKMFGIYSKTLGESEKSNSVTLKALPTGKAHTTYDVYNHDLRVYTSLATRPIIIVYPSAKE